MVVNAVDGKDVWPVIASGTPPPRKEIVHSLEEIRRGDWKFIEEGELLVSCLLPALKGQTAINCRSAAGRVA